MVCICVLVIRGTSMPLVVLLTSSIALPFGGAPVKLTAMPRCVVPVPCATALYVPAIASTIIAIAIILLISFEFYNVKFSHHKLIKKNKEVYRFLVNDK